MFRRAMSTGDLMLSREARYTAEERRERIDKYRSKRNHRNFQKKITYACRKTLADSRPRVKGRFARGGSEDPEAEAVQAAGIPESEAPSEWWPEMQEALATGVDLDNLCDEEMLTAYLGVSSISLYSPSASGQ
ncbi:hypothetical protein HU200_037085 [Digitaria exilis]|uniref:CCT domain-containing protein n=1 Tax=Digitaria exilis TaxID=1010633 RepID=A0A835ELQ0_9POAL|nr:hypothetical protein HU200_037085 [Digitaria exilis]